MVYVRILVGGWWMCDLFRKSKIMFIGVKYVKNVFCC